MAFASHSTTQVSTRRSSRAQVAFALAMAVAAGIAPAAHADATKANNATDLNQAGSWVEGFVPGTADIALFTNTVTTGLTLNLGDPANGMPSWAGIRLTNPGGGIVINDASNASILTLGASGIDLSSATQDLRINSNLSLGAPQTWSIASGRSVTLGGTMINAAPAALTVTGPGTLALDFTSATAPNDNIIQSNTPVSLTGGAKLSVLGGSGGETNSQAFASTALAGAGKSIVNIDSGTGTVNLALGTLSRTAFGSTIVFNAPASGSITAQVGTGVTAAATNGLLWGTGNGTNKAAFATFGTSDWAALVGVTAENPVGTVVSGSTVPGFYTPTGAAIGTGDQNINYDIITNIQSGTTTTSFNTIRFNTATANTYTIRTVIGTGGILVTPNMGATNANINQSGERILGPGRSGTLSEMVIWQNNPLGYLNINTSLYERNPGGGNYTFAGVGTTALNGNNTYAGQTTINGGNVLINSNASLGAIAVGNQVNLNGGNLFYNGTPASVSLDNAGANARTINVMAGGGALAAGTGKNLIVPGTLAGTGPLTIGMGTLTGSGGGTANATAVVGNGTVTLGGNSDAYASRVTVANGTLLVTNTSGSATGTGSVTVNSGATIGGTGTIAGPVIVTSGGHVNPGNPTGALNVNALTLSSGSILDFGFVSGANDSINILNGAPLTLGTGITLNLFQNGGTSPFTANGTYTLFTGASNLIGATPGGLLTNFVIGSPQGNAAYTINHDGTNILLTISGGANAGVWNAAAGGSWGVAGNWIGGIPNAVGDSALFGSVIGSNASVQLDGNRTVSKLTFDNTAASYTIEQGTSGNLILDNGATAVTVTVNGNHVIAAPVVLNSETVITPATSSSLTLANTVSGGGSLTAAGTGTVVLTGNNSVPVTVGTGSTVQVGNGGSTGSIGAAALTINGTLRFNRTGDITLNNDRAGTGTIVQQGTGRLLLGGVAGGTLGLSLAAGSAQLTSATGVSGGALSLAGGTTLDLNGFSATVGTLSGAGTIDNLTAGGDLTLAVNQTAAGTFSGVLKSTTGTLALVKTGGSALVLTGANPLTRDVNINGGNITVLTNGALGTSKVIVNTPTGLILGNGVNFGNTIEIRNVGSSADNISVVDGSSATLSGNITLTPTAGMQFRLSSGGGTLTMTGNATTSYLDGGGILVNPLSTLVRGTMIFAENATIDTGSTLWIGRAGGANVVATFEDNARVISRVAAGADGANLGGNNGMNTASVTLTLRENAFFNMGRDTANNIDGLGNFNLNAGGNGTVTTFNLDGGSIALAGFTKFSPGNSTLNFNGGQVIAGASNANFLPAFNNTAGAPALVANIAAGGARINTNGFDIGIAQPLVGTAGDGGLTKTGAGVLTLSGASNYTGATNIVAGQVTFSTAAHSVGAISGNAAAVDAGATVSAESVRVSSLQVNGGLTLRANGASVGASRVGTLNVDSSTGKIDLTDNALVVSAADAGSQAAVISQVKAHVATGNNGGTWTGNGITSSTLPTLNTPTPSYSLAVVDAGDLNMTSYRGLNGLDANSTIVAVARNGDATLDGAVNAFDLNILAANWQTSGKIWSSGDFTSDGSVDAFDLNVLAANWQFGTGGSLQAALASYPIFGAAGAAAAAVPEPASLAVLALGGAALLGRRRRKA